MPEWSKELFAKNLRYYIDKSGKTQKEVAQAIGVSAPTLNEWLNAKKMARIDKIQKLADYFGILKSDLIEDKSSPSEYYLNEETKQIAQEIYDNPDMKSLFDMSRKMTPERLKAHIELMKQLMGNDNN